MGEDENQQAVLGYVKPMGTGQPCGSLELCRSTGHQLVTDHLKNDKFRDWIRFMLSVPVWVKTR